jgi:hypothetical protein
MNLKVKRGCSCVGCTLALVLEAERLDKSYLEPKPLTYSLPAPPRVITKVIKPNKAAQEQRDKLMFNAGRYAAGAKDKVAEAAHIALEREIDKNG